MKTYKPETNADLEFSFPDELKWFELDKQGVKLPEKMNLADIIIERETDLLLVEIKDPSNISCPKERRLEYLKLLEKQVIKQELTPKARNSYLYLHLMERDSKPMKFVALIGLDAFDDKTQKGVLSGFKDKLLADIRCESHEPWERHHIADCIVMSVDSWNERFRDWPVTRLSSSSV